MKKTYFKTCTSLLFSVKPSKRKPVSTFPGWKFRAAVTAWKVSCSEFFWPVFWNTDQKTRNTDTFHAVCNVRAKNILPRLTFRHQSDMIFWVTLRLANIFVKSLNRGRCRFQYFWTFFYSRGLLARSHSRGVVNCFQCSLGLHFILKPPNLVII